MKLQFARLGEVAQSDASVLIEGETGTGKELVAEALHEASDRAGRPYVVVDCASIPGELIESELFGHLRGAFTGAMTDRIGAFETAGEGTLFIDEIGELPLTLQTRLLRVLERHEIRQVGSNTVKKVNCRIIAATNRKLIAEVEAGRFREDLYFRLNVVKVTLPPLRERPEDIIFLAERFLDEARSDAVKLREDTERRLMEYAWPGNVRELRNIIDRGAAMSDEFFRLPEDFGRSVDFDLDGSGVGLSQRSDEPTDPKESLTRPLWEGRNFKDAKEAVMADFERGYIEALLEEHDGNISAAARTAGVHRNIIHRMMLRHRIQR